MITSNAPTLAAPRTSSVQRPSCPICAGSNSIPWLAAPDRFNGRKVQYQLLRCPSCSLVRLDAPPSKSEIGDHYGSEYDRTIATASQAADHWIPRRDELLRLKGGGNVLDLGCGTGGFLSTLKGSSWNLYGIEMSESASTAARSRCGAKIYTGDILDAPFPSENFDAITAFNLLEHVYEPGEVLAQVAKWLKSDGIFYTMIPNIDSAGARIFRSYWYALELPRHLYHFSPITVQRLAESAGLRAVFIRTHRELYFESSFRYVVDSLLERIGIWRAPLARAGDPSLPWKILRKLFRITLLPLIGVAASFAGDGETITAVFVKADTSNETSV